MKQNYAGGRLCLARNLKGYSRTVLTFPMFLQKNQCIILLGY